LAMVPRPPPKDRLDVLSWFSHDELKLCPFCGERAAVPPEEGPSVCLSCEVLWIDALDKAPQRTA
jgi:hypothetical protein